MSDYDEITEASKSYYETALATHGSGPQAVNWRDTETQELRFDMLLKVGDLSGMRVHDVGCGLAHFHDVLRKKYPDSLYVGSDISEKMILAARTRAGAAPELHHTNILSGTIEPWMKADYVINSGLFTVRGETREDEWWEFVQTMISRMYELSSRGIAFNLMTSFVDYRDDHLFYIHPGKVMDFCVSNLGRNVVIRHDYPLWEYMVYAYK